MSIRRFYLQCYKSSSQRQIRVIREFSREPIKPAQLALISEIKNVALNGVLL